MSAAQARQWLRYWRNSLADAESGSGAMSRKALSDYHKVPAAIIGRGRLDKESAPLQALFAEVPAETLFIKVVLRPAAFLIKQQHEHSKSAFSGFPEAITPVICPIWLSREGEFLPAGRPHIPRDLLSPQYDDKFTLASVQDFDRFLDTQTLQVYSEQEASALFSQRAEPAEENTLWHDYVASARELFKLCDRALLKARYTSQQGGYLKKAEDSVSGSYQILKLYDWLADCEDALPLAQSFALENNAKHLPCTSALSQLVARAGHSGSRFSLAAAQRDALAQVMAMQPGEILAVNGPPGTGKTTFVLSVVASLWVEAAWKESQPPLIIAASTNNQAVTNIIEAFGKDFEENDDPLSGRWLPEVKSYGGYFPAGSLENEAAKHYHTPSFYKCLENEDYIDRAESAFLNRAQTALQDKSLDRVQAVKQRIWNDINAGYQLMAELEVSWQQFEQVRIRYQQADPVKTQAALQAGLLRLREDIAGVEKSLAAWLTFCADESLLLTLLNVVPAVASKRRANRKQLIKNVFSPLARSLVERCDAEQLEPALESWLTQQREAVGDLQRQIAQAHELQEQYQQSKAAWLQLCAPFSNTAEAPSLEEIDRALDRSVRFRLFQLAVHYWEARWLLDYRQHDRDMLIKNRNGNDAQGLKAVRARWARRMSLTPCIVSTLYSLPGHMTYKVFESEGVFNNEYLINEIDLLIVDEAGQVAPDVAAASFALAKRALIIGDVHQIQPVSNQLPAMDIGNLMQHQLLANAADYDELCQQGRSVVSGSVMRIAQQASRYHYLPGAEAGMFLREHRRCYDEIISFCNALCYHGLLEPKRGSAADAKTPPPFPALGYLHIDGLAESPPAGSRINRLEANTIAEWLAAKRHELETFYKAKLEDIVGVVTPFKAQEQLIAEACKQRGIEVGRTEGKMTIGTVHALQGAERKIVLFSAVYSRHSNGKFIDKDNSMLNVAVSRAKESFLVFGDMEAIDAAPRGTPRHLLGEYLARRADSELIFSVGARPDLLLSCREPRVINDAEAHDACLTRILQLAQQRVVIVSPWVSLSRLRESGLLSAMQQAAGREIAVELYTDYRFNTFTNNRYDEEKSVQFNACCTALAAHGIAVHVVNKVHSKLLMADHNFICIGSYNWASAQRQGEYKNFETSLLYSGDLKEEIRIQLASLQARIRSEFAAEMA